MNTLNRVIVAALGWRSCKRSSNSTLRGSLVCRKMLCTSSDGNKRPACVWTTSRYQNKQKKRCGLQLHNMKKEKKAATTMARGNPCLRALLCLARRSHRTARAAHATPPSPVRSGPVRSGLVSAQKVQKSKPSVGRPQTECS